jgi:hypothetical protein
MTDQEKLKAIEDMGIRTETQCPDICYSLKISECACEKETNNENTLTWEGVKTLCRRCWINALESDGWEAKSNAS